MTDSFCDMPAYVREQLPGQWQGADYILGPWRSIPAPQRSVPWQPPAGDTSLTDRVARAVCPRRRAAASPCPALCDDCHAVAVAAAHEIADYFRERYGASNTIDALYSVGTHQLEPQAGWQPINPGQKAAVDSIARELRRPNV